MKSHQEPRNSEKSCNSERREQLNNNFRRWNEPGGTKNPGAKPRREQEETEITEMRTGSLLSTPFPLFPPVQFFLSSVL
jgi:hypothetical protein